MMPWWLIALLTLVFAASGVAAIRMPYAPPRTPATSIEAPQDEYLWEATTLKGVGTELGPYEVYLSEPEFEDPTSYVVFLPGNPGMAGFYCEYADSLCERTAWRRGLSWLNAPFSLYGHFEMQFAPLQFLFTIGSLQGPWTQG